MQIIELHFGKPEIQKIWDIWTDYKYLKKIETESINDYVLRFEKVNVKLNLLKQAIPNKILAIDLIDGANLSSEEKRIIAVKVDLNKEGDILDDVKKSLRELRGTFMSKEKSTFYSGTNSERGNFEDRRSRSKERRPDGNNSEERRNSYGNNRYNYNENRSSPRDRNNRNASRDRYRNASRERNNRNLSRDRNKGEILPTIEMAAIIMEENHIQDQRAVKELYIITLQLKQIFVKIQSI